MQNLSSRHFLSLNQAFFQSSFSVVPKKRSQKLMKKTLEESAPPRPKSATFNFYQFLLGLFKDVINKMSDGGISSMVRDILEDFCKTFEVFFIFQGPEPSESFGFEKRRLWKRSAKTSCRKRVAILHFLFTNYSPRMELLGYKWSIEFLNLMIKSFKF